MKRPDSLLTNVRNEGASADASAPAVSGELVAIFNYPAIGRLFDGPDNQALTEMRNRLEQSNQQAERLIRQGSKDKAERAQRVASALQTTLTLLNELEKMRNPDTPPGTHRPISE
ncbi:MAG: hypothetical protein H0W76_20900 [Pyrinomonadaceae bacterium]|nr:hypothetical protein [Pyrinomonadaceae bacterium]